MDFSVQCVMCTLLFCTGVHQLKDSAQFQHSCFSFCISLSFLMVFYGCIMYLVGSKD